MARKLYVSREMIVIECACQGSLLMETRVKRHLCQGRLMSDRVLPGWISFDFQLMDDVCPIKVCQDASQEESMSVVVYVR